MVRIAYTVAMVCMEAPMACRTNYIRDKAKTTMFDSTDVAVPGADVFLSCFPVPSFVVDSTKGGGNVKRINQYDFYQLGYELHALSELRDEIPLNEAYTPLSNARRWLNVLVSGDLMELRHCRHDVQELLAIVNGIFRVNYNKEDSDELDFNKNWAEEKLGQFAFWGLNTALTRLEHTLSAELREAATYAVRRKGAYETPILVDNAECHIDTKYHPFMSKTVIKDFHDAGRCLAFDLPTAAGFHAARAVEGVLIDYYKKFIGKPPKPTFGMGDMIEGLKKLKPENGVTPAPKTLRCLDQIRDLDRNPLMHPREVLDSDDAMILFQHATSAIMSMCRELKDVKIEKTTPAKPIPEKAKLAAVPDDGS